MSVCMFCSCPCPCPCPSPWPRPCPCHVYVAWKWTWALIFLSCLRHLFKGPAAAAKYRISIKVLIQYLTYSECKKYTHHKSRFRNSFSASLNYFNCDRNPVFYRFSMRHFKMPTKNSRFVLVCQKCPWKIFSFLWHFRRTEIMVATDKILTFVLYSPKGFTSSINVASFKWVLANFLFK